MNQKSEHAKANVGAYYDATAKHYSEQYERHLLTDLTKDYPANYFRLQLLLDSFVNKHVRRVIEVGVGEGTPLATLGKAGIDVCGFDISQEMVVKSKETLSKAEMDPCKIFWGDIEDPLTYAGMLKDGQFDALMAMGVMPHVTNDVQSLKNMKTLVKPGGSVFIEFRNKLFSLFTFNRYTYEFVMDDLLQGVSPALKEIVGEDLSKRLEMEKPLARIVHATNKSAPGYDAIVSKFHNPFEIQELFQSLGFSSIKLLWYHYHPAMPYLEERNQALFRNEGLRLEHDEIGWRGIFLCSAFVVEAVKN